MGYLVQPPRTIKPPRPQSAGVTGNARPSRPSADRSSACYARQLRLRQSAEVRFPQVRAIKLSEAVALGLPKTEVVATI